MRNATRKKEIFEFNEYPISVSLNRNYIGLKVIFNIILELNKSTQDIGLESQWINTNILGKVINKNHMIFVTIQ